MKGLVNEEKGVSFPVIRNIPRLEDQGEFRRVASSKSQTVQE